jgi:hypothetical protein
MNALLTVNGEAVDPALVEEAFLRLKSAAELRSEVSCCERDVEFRARAEEEVIDSILLAQEAERVVPPPAEEAVRAALEAILRQWREHGASWEMLESCRARLREEAVASLRMQAFTAELWKGLPELTEGDLRAWHADHAEEFRVAAAVRAWHLVHFPAAEDPWPAYREMLAWRQQALAGADFAALAREHTRKPGGETDLGWIEQERALHPFEAILFSLGEGETSPVIAHEGAFHLVQAAEVRPSRVLSFEEVAEELGRRAEAAQRREALARLAASLRSSAAVRRAD